MRHVREEQISAFIDNQVDAGEKYQIEAHLRQCPDCRARWAEMLEINRLFQEAESVLPSPYLWNRIAARMDAEKVESYGWKGIILDGLRAHGRKLGLAVGTLTLILATGIMMSHYHSRETAAEAALTLIEQTHKSLAALDPDFYNPFSAGFPGDLNSNPFTTLRQSSKAAPGE